MAQSTEMKDFQEEQYQLWLEENKEFLTRFIVENLKLNIDYMSRSGYQDHYEVNMSLEDYGVFSNNSLYVV